MGSESCRSLQTDGAEQCVKVGRNALIQTVKSVALLFGERRVSRNRSKETSGQRSVDPLEEFQEEHADAVALGHQSITAGALNFLHEAFGAQLREIVAQGCETILLRRGVERGHGRRMQRSGGERIAVGDMGKTVPMASRRRGSDSIALGTPKSATLLEVASVRSAR